MEVGFINNEHAFDDLKSAWDAAYTADYHAQIFLSWPWLRGLVQSFSSNNWLVLACKPNNNSSYIGFFPLRMENVTHSHRLGQIRKLHMAGNPFADYTGFVCLPQSEEKVIATFAMFIQRQLKWERFLLKDVADPRLDVFLRYFSRKKYIIQETDSTSCPYIHLPDSWSQYEENFISSSLRKNIKKYTRKMSKLSNFRISHIQQSNFELQVNTLLSLWQSRWGKKPEYILNRYREIFRRCFENNHLWLPILWDGTTPISGMASFVDYQKRVFSNYINAFNAEYAKISPGTVIVGYGIRYAIENGFKVFDFLRGKEEYKFSFGAKERFSRNLTITRRSIQLTTSKVIRKLKNYLVNQS
jgi:CelD/BcsL family acetyltransferase involved in cellulose biosynthesis